MLDKQQKNQSTITKTNTHSNKDSNNSIGNSDNTNTINVTHSLIENCVGLFRKRRSHQNAMDFDGKYLKCLIMGSVLDAMSKVPKAEPK